MIHTSLNHSLFKQTNKHNIITSRSSYREGSVLLLTLLLVSLLLFLSLSFAVYVRMESRGVLMHQQRTLARAHARLALHLALAQLQKSAGPDRRVTSTAMLLDADPQTPEADHVAHPYWTGVWRKQNAATRSHNPEFQGWLVSLRPDGSGNPSYMDLSRAQNDSLNTSMALTLIGDHTVANPEDRVWAERVDIANPGTGGGRLGRYAYLVLDQGVKASLDSQDPHVGQGGVSEVWAQTLAQRQSPELIPGFSGEIDDESTVVNKGNEIARLLNWDSLDLVNSDFADAGRTHFHEMSLLSHAVQSDTSAGGLKTDLTLAFELPDALFRNLTDFHDSGETNTANGWAQGHELGYLYALESRSGSDTRPVNTKDPAAADWSTSNLKIRGPTWDRLRNFYRLYRERNALGTGGLLARAPGPDRFDGVSREEMQALSYASNKQADVRNRDTFSGLYVFGSLNQSGSLIRVTESALAPVVTRVMYVFSLARDNDTLALVMNNIVVLHNPYDVPIEFRGFKFSPTGLPIERLRVRRRPDPSSPGTPLPDLDKDITDVNNWLRVMKGESTPWTHVNFILTQDGTPSPSNRMVMQPGEVVAFSNTEDPLLYASQTVDVGIASGPEYEVDSGLYFNRFGESAAGTGGNKVEGVALEDSSRVWVEMELKENWRNDLFLTPDTLDASSDSWGTRHQNDALLGRLEIPVGSLSGGGRTIGSLTGDYYTGAELGTSLQDRVPLFVMDARLKPLTQDAAVLASTNPRAMISQRKYLNGGTDHWEARLYEINSFNEIDFDLDVFGGRNNAYWGPSLLAASGKTHLPLFQIPRGPMLSLSDFTHMDAGSFVHDPPYAIGNSFAHPMITRDSVYDYLGSGTLAYSAVDLSYLTNEALWDGYFFSTLWARDDLGWTLPDTVDAFKEGRSPLPNSSFMFYPMAGVTDIQVDTDLKNPQTIAAHLLTRGAFNVNSTSVNAWTAVLSGIRDQEIVLMNGTSETVQGTFFSRLDFPLGGDSDLYNGFLELSDAEIRTLAEEVVQEVKIRGPFLSMADFVNRRLTPDDAGKMGALQAAVEAAGLNSRFPNAAPANGNLPHPENQAPRTAAGAPGYLLQSDILRLIGPRLTARSDTFLVRAYGETGGNATVPASQVWCEALVQRVPEPVEPRSTPSIPDRYEPLDPEWLGRRFKILTFRYLSPDEI